MVHEWVVANGGKEEAHPIRSTTIRHAYSKSAVWVQMPYLKDRKGFEYAQGCYKYVTASPRRSLKIMTNKNMLDKPHENAPAPPTPGKCYAHTELKNQEI